MHHLFIQYICLLTFILFVVMLAKKIRIAYSILLVLAEQLIRQQLELLDLEEEKMRQYFG